MQVQPNPPQDPVDRDQLASLEFALDPIESLIAFDVECTGLSGAPHLLELGAVRIEDGEVQDHFQSLVAPLVPIEPEAYAVHGIDEEAVRSAPFAAKALAEFFEWIGDAPLLAHNGRVDAHVLAFECARAGISGPSNPIYDSLALARKAWPDSPDHRLDTLVEYLNLESDDLHRALPDAMACWQVSAASLEQLEAGEGFTHAQLAGWSSNPTSIAKRMPVRPIRKPSLLRKLDQAQTADQALTLVYGDKINPPARLQVYPKLMYRANQHDYLEGECQRSGTLKTYRVDRIIKVETKN
jgi:DNA polymerase III epsilon subunit-like protein